MMTMLMMEMKSLMVIVTWRNERRLDICLKIATWEPRSAKSVKSAQIASGAPIGFAVADTYRSQPTSQDFHVCKDGFVS